MTLLKRVGFALAWIAVGFAVTMVALYIADELGWT